MLVREEAMYGTGFFPTDRAQVYETVDGDCLVGTSEVPLAAMHMQEFLEAEKLPLRYAGYSSCFRREAGAAGRDTRGILRVHQFDKVEMFSFCLPEQSAVEHELILSAEEEILQGLGIPYRVVNIAAGDLGAPAAQKFDCEAWMPGQQQYREVTSCSNCTDYQARRLDCRYRTDKGPRFVHTLNGTGIAVGRTLIAIMENYQRADGTHRRAGGAAPAHGQGRAGGLSAAVARPRRGRAAHSTGSAAPNAGASPFSRHGMTKQRTSTSGEGVLEQRLHAPQVAGQQLLLVEPQTAEAAARRRSSPGATRGRWCGCRAGRSACARSRARRAAPCPAA